MTVAPIHYTMVKFCHFTGCLKEFIIANLFFSFSMCSCQCTYYRFLVRETFDWIHQSLHI